MPYEEYFDSEKCIDVGDDDYCYLIPIRPYKKGDKLALPDVFFFPNSTKLKKESFETLDQLVTYLEYNPASIRVNGHTQGNKKISNNSSKVDADLRFKGSAKKLSKKRADKVCEYIINKGISPKRISSKGFAGRKPIVKEPKTRSDREKNMRVEIEIVELNSDSLLNK
jgi:outer membrane protein OmpA-like peptidoglycan-associated protein